MDPSSPAHKKPAITMPSVGSGWASSDILLEICNFLDLKSLSSFAGTCKSWSESCRAYQSKTATEFIKNFRKKREEQGLWNGEDYLDKMKRLGKKESDYVPILIRAKDALADTADYSVVHLQDIPKEFDYNEEVDKSAVLGVSKFGGVPHVGDDFVWPSTGKRKARFVSQLNLDDFTLYDLAGLLPSNGMMYFFSSGVIHKQNTQEIKKLLVDKERPFRCILAKGFKIITKSSSGNHFPTFDDIEGIDLEGEEDTFVDDKEYLSLYTCGPDELGHVAMYNFVLDWNSVKKQKWNKVKPIYEEC